MNKKIKRLYGEEKKQKEEFRIYWLLQTTKVITQVNCFGVVGLVLLNIMAIVFWWFFTTTSIKTFIGMYLFLGVLVNCCLIILHSTWQEHYINKKADYINKELEKIHELYMYKIEEAKEEEPSKSVQPEPEIENDSIQISISANKRSE